MKGSRVTPRMGCLRSVQRPCDRLLTHAWQRPSAPVYTLRCSRYGSLRLPHAKALWQNRHIWNTTKERPMANCPKCDKPLLNMAIEEVSALNFRGKSFHGVAFL